VLSSIAFFWGKKNILKEWFSEVLPAPHRGYLCRPACSHLFFVFEDKNDYKNNTVGVLVLLSSIFVFVEK